MGAIFKMKKTKEMITLEQARERIKFFNSVEIYRPITLTKKVIGYGLIGYGVATILMPTGSIWAIMVGCTLVGIDYKKLLNTMKFYGKKMVDWTSVRLMR